MYRQHQPLVSSKNDIHTAYHKVCRYFSRVYKFEQMDFQFALWQMLYLLVAPQKLSNVFRARKNFKSQYARDDPAFLILFAGALCLTSVGFSIALNYTLLQFIRFLMIEIFIDCIAIGVVLATTLWYCANRFLKPKNTPYDVEWGFAFDIHLNAFFPPIVFLHVLLILCYKAFMEDATGNVGIVTIMFGNSFWLASVVYYFYITFLGYNSMQILQNVHVLLRAIPVAVFMYLLSVYMRFNITISVFTMYKDRV